MSNANHTRQELVPPVPQKDVLISPQTPGRIAFTWLLKLRWGAVACQVLIIVFVALFFTINLPLAVVFAIIAFQAASNCLFSFLLQRNAKIDRMVAPVMFLDIILLTLLLYYTGGPMNPFTFLYLVHVVLGAIVLSRKQAWSLALFTLFSYGSFFFVPAGGVITFLTGEPATTIQEICVDVEAVESHMDLHLQGMWVAFAFTSVFVVFFVGRIQQGLERHQQTLAELKEAQLRNEKLASLATLSAGAAHEFSTPLATIAVATGEMLHSLKDHDAELAEVVDDVHLVREQVTRCQEILFQMAADAGEHLGEPLQDITLAELIDQSLSLLRDEDRSRIRLENNAGPMTLKIPARTLQRTIKGLLQNGIDASPATTQVSLRCDRDSESLWFTVQDFGAGMDAATQRRALEPFYTTKPPGKGLGLGLFLAKSVAERYGGEISLISEAGQGSTVSCRLALQHIITQNS